MLRLRASQLWTATGACSRGSRRRSAKAWIRCSATSSRASDGGLRRPRDGASPQFSGVRTLPSSWWCGFDSRRPLASQDRAGPSRTSDPVRRSIQLVLDRGVAGPRRGPPVVVAREGLDGLLRRVPVPDPEMIRRVPEQVARARVRELDLGLRSGSLRPPAPPGRPCAARPETAAAGACAGADSTFGWAAGTGAIIVACGGATAFSSSTLGSTFGSSALDASAILGGVTAAAGTSSTSHDPHQRHLIAASSISSAQYGQVFIGALLPCSA